MKETITFLYIISLANFVFWGYRYLKQISNAKLIYRIWFNEKYKIDLKEKLYDSKKHLSSIFNRKEVPQTFTFKTMILVSLDLFWLSKKNI